MTHETYFDEFVIRDEGDQALMRMAGLDEEDDLFAPVFVTSRRRMLWLGVNLATALLAADGSPDSLRAPSVSQCKRKKGKKHSEGGKKKDKKKKKNYGFEL